MRILAAIVVALAVPTSAQEGAIDARIRASWKPGTEAAPAVSDGLYLRRVMLDLVGAPPGGEATRAFILDPDPLKRQRIVDELLQTRRFEDHWARRLSEVLIGGTTTMRADLPSPLAADVRARLATGFVHWMARKIRLDRPWGEIVTEMASARGTSDRRPELAWKLSFYRDGDPTRRFADEAARQLMGVNLACARCHDHPFDKWGPDDHAGMAAFVCRMTVRVLPAGKEVPVRVEVDEAADGEFQSEELRGRAAPVLFTNGGAPRVGEGRQEALGWLLAHPTNRQLSLVFVNRVWAWLIGQGVVNPVDDFNLRNKPLVRGLLEDLEKDFVAQGRSLKSLVRAICRSAVYQRESTGEGPAARRFDGSRALIRPLSAEQLVNSIRAATRLEPDRDLGVARQLAMEVCPPLTAPAVEGTPLPFNRWLALFARNGEEVDEGIREGGVLDRIRAAGGTLESRVDLMYLWALSRPPSESERSRTAAFLTSRGPSALDDAYWTLLNSHEFLTRH